MAEQTEQMFRLSAQQRSLWLTQDEEGVFLARCAVRIDGDLQLPLLREVACDLVKRHEILRTGFRRQPGRKMPVQAVAAHGEPVWLAPGEEPGLDRPWDLASPNPLRLSLATLGPGRHRLQVALPALCGDAESLRLLVGDLLRGYEARRAGRACEDEPFQYVDFAQWQEQVLCDGDEEALAGRAYWAGFDLSRLAGVRFPFERPEEAGGPFVPAGLDRPLDPRLTAALEAAAAGCEVPAASFLFAAWQVLVWRLTGEEELLSGRLFDGRGYEDFATALGPFAAYLPVRVSLGAGTRFRDLAQQLAVAEETGARLQEYGVLDPAGGAPRFPAVFEVADWTRLPAATGLTLSLERQAACCGPFKLKLCGVRTREGLRLDLHYHPWLFAASDAVACLERLDQVLRAAVADPAIPVGEIEILAPTERQRLLVEVNQTCRDFVASRMFHERFAQQAARTPDAPAVISAQGVSTYGELNRQANRLAHHLRSLGVEPEDRVAICLERSQDFIVAILGALKAGGAYVPLDPVLPRERLAAMLEDAEAAAVITWERLLTALPASGAPVICLDRDEPRLATCRTSDPAPRVDGGHLAYVLFTSGSTGRPKGVAVEHRQLLNYVDGVLERLAPPAGARFAVVSTFSADLGHTMVFPALATGSSLHVIPAQEVSHPQLLAETFQRHAIDCLKIVPSHLAALLTADESGSVLPRQRLVLGGEASSWELMDRIGTLAPDCRVLNHYGPTETTVGVLAFPVEPGASRYGLTVPLGRPLANSTVYLLDSRWRPVPTLVDGELFLGGAGVTRGYLGRPDLTAERFLPDPFSALPGSRLYRTGDRARFLPDGNLEFRGRIDHQVKIRGFRVELGEIEAVLGQHPDLWDVAVVLRQDGGPEKRLVAYVAPRRGASPEGAALREFLERSLPDYMIPAAFVRLDKLPVTANGKLDVAALPAPEQARGGGRGYVPPATPVERTLAAVWAELLGRDKVGLHDNFFEMGGDSILAIQAIARLNRAGLRLNPKQLFEHQTIARLAAIVDQEPVDTAVAAPQPVTGDVPLTPIQRWFFAQGFAEPHHWNQSLLLEIDPALTPQVVAGALAHLIAHHDALRSRFQRAAGGWRQSVAAVEAAVPFVRIDLSALPEEARPRGLEEAAARVQASLDLGQGPLVRAAWFDLGSSRRLLCAIHHLVVDGISWRILLEDLETVSRQLLGGEAVQLLPRTTTCQQWAERLVAHARSGALVGELAAWQAAVPPVVAPLPRDAAVAGATLADERRIAVSLSAEGTRLLLQEVPAAYRTQINDVLLTAVARGLARWSGQRGALIELEGHGREDLFAGVDLSRTVGWFTTHFPLYLEPGAEARPEASLRAVKEQLRRVPGRGIGHGLLRYLAAEEESALSGLPEPEVKFNYLGQLDRVLGEESLFRPACEAAGPDRSPRARRARALAIDSGILGGRLYLRWAHDGAWRDETVRRLAETVLAELRGLIAHCTSVEPGGWTASDFPLVRLGEEALERALAGRRGIEDVYPVSPLQKALLFHVLSAPGSQVGFEQKSTTLQGPLDVALLRRTWQRVVDRHPILRTAFVSEGLEEPLQVVHREVELPLEQEDWRGLPAGDLPARLEAALREDRRRGFDLSRPPLLRLWLIRLADDVHQLVWSYHHLLLDAWGRNMLLREVFATYSALCHGGEPEPSASRPYRDYIAWLQCQDLDAAADLWRRTLAGCRPTVLPAARPPGRSRPETDVYDQRPLQLSAEETQRLQAFARQHKITLGTVLHGAWALLLSGWGGERDVLFGTTVSGRPVDLDGSESMVGMFINNLPVRVRTPAAAPLPSWLADLQEQLVELRQHEWVAPDQIQSWSGIPAERLFESLVLFQNYPVDEAVQKDSLAGVQVVSVRGRLETSYPLTVVAGPLEPLLLRFYHDLRRTDGAVVERLLRSLGALLHGMVSGPDLALGALPLLADSERRQLLAAGEGVALTRVPRTVQREVAAVADRSPAAPAVAAADGALCRRDLLDRAARIASRLSARGVAPGDRVLVALGATTDLAAGLLGILMAGAAFVPVGPDADLGDVDLLDGVGVKHVVGRGLTPSADHAIIDLSVLEGAPPLATSGIPLDETLLDLPACVLLREATGGSVELSHAALAVAVTAELERGAVRDGETVFILAGPPWSAVVVDLLAALAAGAVAVLAEAASTDVPCLLRRLEESGATRLQAPPALWQELLAAGWGGNPALRAVCRGEAPARGLAGELLSRVGSLQSFPGIPEVAGPAVFHRAGAGPGLRIRVLSADLEPLPPGVAGWLYVGGTALARGYAGQPDRTAAVFLPDPFVPGERLFHTGERALLLPDGGIELRGRSDRAAPALAAELAEAEAVLRDHPAVHAAAVVTWRDAAGETQRVAYVAPPPPGGVHPLHEHLKERLPRSRVPGLFVLLDRFPWTPNGRLDRQALPAPGEVGATTFVPRAFLGSATELRLQKIWEDLFGIRPIGQRDDFFALGGHSLLAVRLIERIRQELGRDLPLSILLRATTVEALARELESRSLPSPWTPLVEIQAGGTQPPLFCVHPLGGEVLCYIDLAHALGPDQPVYGLQARAWGDGEGEAPATIQGMAAAYIAAMREVQPHGPYRLAGWSLGGLLALEMAQQLRAAGEEIHLLAALDTLMAPRAEEPETDIPQALASLAGHHPAVVAEHLRSLPTLDEQLACFVELVNRERIVPGLELQTLRRYTRATLANAEAKGSYVPRPYPGKIVLFRAREGHVLSCADPTLGWGALAAGGLDIREVQGRHDTLAYRPHVHDLAQVLKDYLQTHHREEPC